jgi:hypothetical protein
VRLVLVVDFFVEVSVVLYENTRHNRPTATINTRPATIPVYPQNPRSDMLLPPFLWGRVSKPSARRPYANSVVMMRSLPPARSLGWRDTTALYNPPPEECTTRAKTAP